MPAHLRTQLRKAIVAALLPTPTASGRVYASRTWPLEEASYPCLLVYARGGGSAFDCAAPTDSEIPLARAEDVVVEGRARISGAEPEDTLQQLADDIEVALMADPALGALVLNRELTTTEFDQRALGDSREGAVRLTWSFLLRTPAGDPTVTV